MSTSFNCRIRSADMKVWSGCEAFFSSAILETVNQRHIECPNTRRVLDKEREAGGELGIAVRSRALAGEGALVLERNSAISDRERAKPPSIHRLLCIPHLPRLFSPTSCLSRLCEGSQLPTTRNQLAPCPRQAGPRALLLEVEVSGLGACLRSSRWRRPPQLGQPQLQVALCRSRI